MEAMLTTPTSHKSTCSYCRISGHEIANCYQLIGFPDWWERNRAKASRGSSLDRDRERTGGGRSNSYPHATRGKGHGQGRAHSGWADAVIDNGGRLQAMSGAHNDWVNAAIEGGRGLQITAPGTSANSGIPGLSTEQWKSLLNILQNQANSNRLSCKVVITWIFYSGCSHHMTGTGDLFMNLYPVSPYIIRLPDGTKVVASGLGTVCAG